MSVPAHALGVGRVEDRGDVEAGHVEERAALDGRRVRGDKTRHAILARAAQIASTEGLEGLSLGQLAADLGMSKSGLFAHFGSKEELQLKTLRAARRIFYDAAVAPALDVPEGIERLAALVMADLDYLSGDVFDGGCLFISAAAEYDSRPGPIRDLVADTMGSWLDLLTEHARVAKGLGQLTEETDPRGLVWELHAFGLALNWDHQLNGSPDARRRAQTAASSRLRAAATEKGRRLLDAMPAR
jgi:AcrR family transcriptional regulator